MKTFGRKILSILLVFVMVVVVPEVSFTVYANDLPGWATSAGLSDETASWDASSGTLTLLQNVTVAGTMDVSGAVTFDLNGHNITGSVDSGIFKVTDGNTLTLTGTGTLTGKKGCFTEGSLDGDNRAGAVVYIKGGTFYLKGGMLTSTSDVSVWGGSAVGLDGGSFVMTGGELSGSQASTNGVVLIFKGNFEMSGGSIYNNKSSGVMMYRCDNDQYNSNAGGSFLMTGGSIYGNQSGDWGGGGVNVEWGAFTMTGGSIHDNVVKSNSNKNGGGVLVSDSGSCSVSGDARVYDNLAKDGTSSDNVYLEDKKINISGALDSSASIGISMKDSGVFTNSMNTDYNDKDKFFSDNSSYGILKNSDGQLYLGNPPVASVTVGSTIQEYETFSSAVNAWNSVTGGAELKLLSDVTTSSTINVNGTKTLDLNGCDITMTGSSSVITTNSSTDLSLKNTGSGGGVISGGRGQTESSDNNVRGGGLYIRGGSVTMYDGVAISGNNGGSYGGGVHIRSNGSFTMEGGKITNNTVSGGWNGGAGVHLDDYGTFTMKGGSITENVDAANGDSVGVMANDHATLDLQGGTIAGNGSNQSNTTTYAVMCGGKSTIKLSGGISISGKSTGSAKVVDLYLGKENSGEEAMVTITGGLTGSTPIKVEMNGSPRVFTNSVDTDYNDAEKFSSVDSHYSVLKDGTSGQLYLGIPPVARVTDGSTTTNYTTFSEAVTAWNGAASGAELELLANVETSSTIQVSDTKTLDLNGYGITKTGGDNVIWITGGNLTVNDSNTTTTHYFNVQDGMAVDINDTSGTKSFNGGYITGGTGRAFDSLFGCDGGGVYLDGGSFTLNGGTILGNTTGNDNGGGVEIYSGTMTMNGGAICYNKIGIGLRAGSSQYNRGGGATTANFVMYDGVIANNKTRGVLHDWWCYGDDFATFYGGSVINNGDWGISAKYLTIAGNVTVSGNAKGVTFASSPAAISGSPVISGNTDKNLYLSDAQTINISGSLSDANIGMTMQTPGVFTSSTNTDYNIADKFTSDDSTYEVVKGSDGQLKLLIHAHEWSYTVEGAAIKASCIGEGTCEYDSDGFSFMLNAPEDLVYDGKAKPASISGNPEVNPDIEVDGLAEAPTTITYYLSTGARSTVISGEALEGAPADAGNYVAQMTWGEVTASLAFTIEKAAAGITTLPQAKSLLYIGGPQELVTAGVAENGTMKYALGTDGKKAPAASAFKTSVTSASNAGDYYVWYKVAGDANHKDTEAACITVTIYRRSIQVKGIKAKNKTYDGTTEAELDFSGVSLEKCGMLKSDSLSVKAKGTFEDGNAGEKKKILISDFVLSGSSAANYVLTEGTQQTEAEADITKRAVFVKAKDQTVALKGSIEESVDRAVLEGAVSGHELSAVKLTAGSTEKVTVSGTIMPSDAVILDGNTDVTENYSIFYTAGILTVKKGEASPGTVPEPKTGLMENGSGQELVTAGKSEDGIYVYRLGKTGTWGTEVPKAVKAGTYVVFYFLRGDVDHTDIGSQDEPQGSCTVIIASKEVAGVTGKVLQADGETPVGDVEVLLKQGGRKVESVRTAEDGIYQLTAGTGKYNLVVVWKPDDGRGELTKTMMIELEGSMEVDIILPEGQVNSILKVGEDSPEVLVDGLDAEAEAIQKETGGGFVEVVMKVDEKTEKDAAKDDGAAAIGEKAPEKKLDFYEILVEKTVDSRTTRMENTRNVMEIIIPYLHTGRREVCAYRYHGAEVQELKEASTKEDGTFLVDKEAGVICIYASRFSTYAIGYTPYHKVSSTLTLGDYTGDAAVTLEKADSGEKVKTMTIPVKNGTGTCEVSDMPKGAYLLTVEWEDGKACQIALPFEIN